MNESSPILLFDGVCNLCNRLVIFLIRRDKKARIKFAPLQSQTGELYLEKNNLAIDEINSIVYIEGENLFLKSSAILHLFKVLGGVWSMIYLLSIIPKFIRDFFYDSVAKSRYRIFGKADACMVPSAEFADRFLI